MKMKVTVMEEFDGWTPSLETQDGETRFLPEYFEVKYKDWDWNSFYVLIGGTRILKSGDVGVKKEFIRLDEIWEGNLPVVCQYYIDIIEDFLCNEMEDLSVVYDAIDRYLEEEVYEARN